MITNVNPRPNPRAISWGDFLALCKSCNLVVNGPDEQERYSTSFGRTEIMHQIRKLKSGDLRATGWFSCDFGEDREFNGHSLTKEGEVSIIETINPNAPMTLADQPHFSYLFGQVLLAKKN